MSKPRETTKAFYGVLVDTSRFASRNRMTLSLAAAGLAAAALLIGQRATAAAASLRAGLPMPSLAPLRANRDR